MPESASVQVKAIPTSDVYQPLLPSVPETTAQVITGTILSISTGPKLVVAVLFALSIAVPGTVTPVTAVLVTIWYVAVTDAPLAPGPVGPVTWSPPVSPG